MRDPQEMLTHHLLDSLAAVLPLCVAIWRSWRKWRVQGRGAPAGCGSGGGLPGVVFAICCPELDVSCVDTVGKKAAFIQQAAVALKLRNLHGLHARVETLTEAFDVVSCRAFASLPDFVVVALCTGCVPRRGLAMKGKHPADEIAALPADVKVFHVEQLAVPGWMQSAASSGCSPSECVFCGDWVVCGRRLAARCRHRVA